jgi:hypothetical protein
MAGPRVTGDPSLAHRGGGAYIGPIESQGSDIGTDAAGRPWGQVKAPNTGEIE